MIMSAHNHILINQLTNEKDLMKQLAFHFKHCFCVSNHNVIRTIFKSTFFLSTVIAPFCSSSARNKSVLEIVKI